MVVAVDLFTGALVEMALCNTANHSPYRQIHFDTVTRVCTVGPCAVRHAYLLEKILSTLFSAPSCNAGLTIPTDKAMF